MRHSGKDRCVDHRAARNRQHLCGCHVVRRYKAVQIAVRKVKDQKRLCARGIHIGFFTHSSIIFLCFGVLFGQVLDDRRPLALTDHLCIRLCGFGAALGVDHSKQIIDRLCSAVRLTQTERTLLIRAVHYAVPDKGIDKLCLCRRIICIGKRCRLPLLRCIIARCAVYGKVIDDDGTKRLLIQVRLRCKEFSEDVQIAHRQIRRIQAVRCFGIVPDAVIQRIGSIRCRGNTPRGLLSHFCSKRRQKRTCRRPEVGDRNIHAAVYAVRTERKVRKTHNCRIFFDSFVQLICCITEIIPVDPFIHLIADDKVDRRVCR